MISKKFAAISVLALAVTGGGLYGLAEAQSPAPESSNACEQRVTLLNNRSRLLENYKAGEDKKYKVKRDKWAKRIAYASQWTRGEAEKSRDALYELDAKHRNMTSELDSQIGAYKYLEASPLDCHSDANRSQVMSKLEEVKGIKDRKAVGGQALIEKLKSQETEFEKTAFKERTDNLVKELHAAKKKSPAPKEQSFEVKAY